MKILKNFLNFLYSVYQNNYMIRSIVIRDIKARYTGSFLGIFWTIIHPLTQMLVYYFIFSIILKIRLGPEYDRTDFSIWLIAGLLLWLFFAEVVNRSPGAVLDQSHLITKMVFPSEILPFTNLVAALVNHLIATTIFIGFLVLSGYGLSMKILWLIPALLCTAIFGLGLSWLLSALNVFLRDIGQIIGVFVNIWFFLTPIIYPRHAIPKNLQTLYSVNPMLHAIEAYRTALLGKTEIDIQGLGYLLVPGLISFVLGGLIFKKLKPGFADVL